MVVNVEVRGGTLQDVVSADVVEHGILRVVDSEGTTHLMSPHYWLHIVTLEEPDR